MLVYAAQKKRDQNRMTRNQRKLIDKTIGWTGWAALTTWALLMLWGAARVLIGTLSLKSFFSGMFSVEDAALILWPLFGVGMRAGET